MNRFLPLILFACWNGMAAAAAPDPAIQPDCRDMPGSFAWSLPTIRSMQAGETLVIAVGGDDHFLDHVRVRLGSQAFARVEGGVRSSANRAAIVWFSHQLNTNSAIGTTLAIDLAPTSDAPQVCVQAYVFPRGMAPLQRFAHDRSQGNSAQTTSAIPAGERGTILTTAWFSSTTLPVTSSGQILDAHCGVGGTPCMVTTSVDVLPGPGSVTITPAFAQRWSVASIGLFDPSLFADGFE